MEAMALHPNARVDPALSRGPAAQSSVRPSLLARSSAPHRADAHIAVGTRPYSAGLRIRAEVQTRNSEVAATLQKTPSPSRALLPLDSILEGVPEGAVRSVSDGTRIASATSEPEPREQASGWHSLGALRDVSDERNQEGLEPAGSRGASGILQRALPQMPARYWTIAQTSLAFVLANMDKVNMSVAIIPMAHQFGWNAATAGLVQSSFFWGYALSLVPSGWLAAKFTGQRVLRGGVVLWSLGTAIVPSCATSMPLLMLSRGLVGFGEGVAPPAATDLVARTMPAEEGTRAVSTVFNGFNVGSILGLLAAPFLIENLGWESVFYLFGAAGIVWSVAFDPPQHDPLQPQEQPGPARTPAASHLTNLEPAQTAQGSAISEEDSGGRVPWQGILQNKAVWSLVFVHVAQNWGHFCLLAWLPTFYNEGLHMDLSQSALVSIVPPVLSIAISGIAAPLADKFVKSGTSVTLVRKVAQGIAFVGPAVCLGLVGCSDSLELPQWGVVALLSLGLGLSSCAYAGLYCSHQDMSKKYASVLLGVTTTAGAVPGIVGVPLTGLLFDNTHSWMLSLFLPSIIFYIAGTLVFGLFGDCRPQHFGDDSTGKKLS